MGCGHSLNLGMSDILPDYWFVCLRTDKDFSDQFVSIYLLFDRFKPRAEDRDSEILNGVGSGIALGHPVGQTGARLIITMINEMKRRNVRYGCASLCASGGPGVAFNCGVYLTIP